MDKENFTILSPKFLFFFQQGSLLLPTEIKTNVQTDG